MQKIVSLLRWRKNNVSEIMASQHKPGTVAICLHFLDYLIKPHNTPAVPKSHVINVCILGQSLIVEQRIKLRKANAQIPRACRTMGRLKEVSVMLMSSCVQIWHRFPLVQATDGHIIHRYCILSSQLTSGC